MTRSAAGYYRVSTDRQASGFSLDEQQETARAWCKAHDLTLDAEYQEAESGGKVTRSEYGKMLTAARSHSFTVLVIRDLSRFGRNRWEAMARVGELMLLGVEIHEVAKKRIIDADSGVDFVQTALDAYVAHEERANIREKSMAGQRQAARSGVIPGFAPYGYRREGGGFVVDPKPAATVREIFRLYLDRNAGVRGIAVVLNARGIPAPSGGRWGSTSVYEVLSREAYAGTHTWGGIPILIPAIIPLERYQDAQTRRRAKRRLPSSSQSPSYLLSGLVKCGHCGYSLIGHRYPRQPNRSRYYFCGNHRRGLGCEYANMWRTDELEALVLDYISSDLPNADEKRERIERDAGRIGEEIAALERTIARYDAAAKRNVKAWAESEYANDSQYRMEQSEIASLKAEAEKSLKGLQEERQDALHRASRLTPAPTELTLREALERLPVVEAKARLQAIITRIDVYCFPRRRVVIS